MELRHLRYFAAVAEELHFGRAAERLHIAQPPLSQQIQQLERELGVSLFHRSSRRVALTAAGQAFFEDSLRILAAVDQAAVRARRADRGEIGTLAVGFVATATYETLPRLLPAFRSRCPDVRLELFEMNAGEQAQALRDRRIDVGLLRPAVEDEALAAEAVHREPFIVALPDSHPLAAHAAIALADLAEEPFILFPDRPKPSYTDTIRAVCARAGFAPQVAQQARQMQTALSLIAAGLGLTLVPASVQNLQRAGVAYRPLEGEAVVTELSAAYRRDDPSPTLFQFLQIVREYAKDLTGPAPQ